MESDISSRCDYWALKYDLVSLASVSNTIYALVFTIPGIFALSLKWYRIFVLLAHVVWFFTSIHYCDPHSSIFATAFIFANLIRLSQSVLSNRKAQLPKHLRSVFEKIFQPYNISVPDFVLLTRNSKVIDIDNEEVIFAKGDVKTNPMNIAMLLRGQVSAKSQGLYLHGVSSFEFLDSVEWKDFNFKKKISHNLESPNNGIETDNEDGMEIQVELIAQENSSYLLFDGQQLKHVQKEKPNLFYIFDAIVCRDVTHKLYSINDKIKKDSDNKSSCSTLVDFNPLVRSLSFDCLQTASNGRVVSQNWLKADNRILTLKCLHDAKDNLIIPNTLIVPKLRLANFTNPDVAYLMQHSHPKVTNRYREQDVIPSLILQSRHFNPEACRFRNPDFVREVDWSKSMEHCGLCVVCRPISENDGPKTGSQTNSSGL